MTNNGITSLFRGSKIAIEPSSALSLDDKVTLFEKTTIPSGNTPSCVSKFINHLMTSGKKGVAIALFFTSLRLFLKELRENKKIDGSGRSSTGFEDSASPTLSKKSPLESLISGRDQARRDLLSTKSLFLLQKPCKNLLGLDFFLPSPTIENYQVPFPLKNRKEPILQAISSLAREVGGTEKLEVREVDISVRPSRFLLCYQGPLSARNHSIMSGESSNTVSLQSLRLQRKLQASSINKRVVSVGLGFHGESRKAQFSHSLSLLSYLESALGNVEPNLEIRKKKIAGITRQIPCIVSKSRGQGLAIRWLINAAEERRRRESQSFSKSLAEELVNAYYKRGEPRQKRDSLHKLAESNRSFLRYRWW